MAMVPLLVAAGGCAGHRQAYARIRSDVVTSRPRHVDGGTPRSGAAVVRAEPALAASDRLELEEVRRLVLARNPSLAAMHDAWQAAVSRYPQEIALEDPMFGYAAAPRSFGSDDVDAGQRFELSQRFPWPGKRRLRGDAALGAAEAVGHDFEATRQRLIETAESAFYDYYFVHRAIEINEINQELLRELKQIAEQRYGAGLVGKQDALQTVVEHLHLKHQGVVLHRMRAVARARLNTLLNLPPQGELPAPPRSLPATGDVPDRALLEDHALRRRPELSALEARVREHEAYVALAKREYFPDLAVNGAYDSMWEMTEMQTIVGFGFNVPLRVERREAALAEAEANARRARAELEAERNQVLYEVSTAVDEVHENAHVVQLYGASIVPAAEESLASAMSGYRTGTNGFLALVAAEKALMTARLNYESALTDYHQARTRLERAVGGGVDTVEDRT
jgi:outer membrane protein TolC